MTELFFYIIPLNIIVFFIIIYSSLKSKKPAYATSPVKHLIIHFILVLIIFIFTCNQAVIYSQVGNDENSMALSGMFFVVVALLLLIFKSLVIKINLVIIVVSIGMLDLFEYIVLSHTSFYQFSWIIVNHTILLLVSHLLAFYLIYTIYKTKSVSTE